MFDWTLNQPIVKMIKELRLFRAWLVIVAILRVVAIVTGLFYVDIYGTKVFYHQYDQVSPLFGRIFAVMNLCSMASVLTLAITPKNRAIYFLNMTLFAVVFVYFSG